MTTARASQLTLADGREIAVTLEPSPLVRWWRWSEYALRPYRGRQLCECMSEVVWCDDQIAEHRVLPLGYPDCLKGALLIALADGRFLATSSHCVFPILDDDRATTGAAEFEAATIERVAREPVLL